MQKSIIYIFCFLILPYSIKSQTVKVLNIATGYPVPNVTVTDADSSYVVFTDNEGRFDLEELNNPDTIIAYHELFISLAVSVVDLENSGYQLFLKPNMILQQELKISLLNATKYASDLPFDTKVVDYDVIKEAYDKQEDEYMMNAADKLQLNLRYGENYAPILGGINLQRVTFAIEGVRLENSLYRNGRIPKTVIFNNKNLDVSRTVIGTSTLFYSSHSAAGVLHYFLKSPEYVSYGQRFFGMNAELKYSTADRTAYSHADVSFATDKFTLFVSAAYGNHHDIKIGKNRPSYMEKSYGLHKYKVIQLAGVDTFVTNDDVYMQYGTAYSSCDYLHVLRYKVNDYLSVKNFFILNHTSKTGIYSAIVDKNGWHPRFAEAWFLPADNIITSVQIMHEKANEFYDKMAVSLAYQYNTEKRLTRKYKNDYALYQFENLNFFSLNADFVKMKEINRLNYGIEIKNDYLKSYSYLKNIFTDSTLHGLNRYPGNGSKSFGVALYGAYKWVYSSQLTFDAAIRLHYENIRADFDTIKPNLNLNYTKVTRNDFCPSASVGADYLTLVGLRAGLVFTFEKYHPIIDDFAKVMTYANRVIIPNKDLEAEKRFNIEFYSSYKVTKEFSLSASFYTMLVKDIIGWKPDSLNGRQTLFFGSDEYFILSNQNYGFATVSGVSFFTNLNITFEDNHSLIIKNKLSMHSGNCTDSLCVLPGIQPMSSQTVLIFRNKVYEIGGSLVFNASKLRSSLSPYGEDGIDFASTFGFYSWSIYNLWATYTYNSHYRIEFTVNNITDKYYRRYGSAVSSPGRNFIITLRYII